MSKRSKASPKKLSQEFVGSSDDEEAGAPRLKKQKKETKKGKKAKIESEEEQDDEEEEEKPKAKKIKKSAQKREPSSDEEEDEPAAGGLDKNDQGDSFLALEGGNKARLTIRSFKGKTLIDIRETYEKDGKDGLPGKKGISLQPPQWELIKQHLGAIDTAIARL